MLRRIKKDVENELSDKIEVMVYCPLTTRQNLLYVALKRKIKIEDLLHYTVGGGDSHAVDKSFTSNLMNLVMQFRKVTTSTINNYFIMQVFVFRCVIIRSCLKGGTQNHQLECPIFFITFLI